MIICESLSVLDGGFYQIDNKRKAIDFKQLAISVLNSTDQNHY
jgi:hypothetical protein